MELAWRRKGRFVGLDPPGGPYDASTRNAEIARAAAALEEAATQLHAMGVETSHRVEEGPTVSVILDVCRSSDAAMIVISGRRHNVVHRVALGSVVSSVLKAAPVPVVVVPPAEGEPRHNLAMALDRLVEFLTREEAKHEAAAGGGAAAGLAELREASVNGLDRAAATGDRHQGLAVLKDKLLTFESHHPGLTQAVNDVSYFLSTQGV